MDRLPTRKELVFNRVHKDLYKRLTTVIRSLGGKFLSPSREQIWSCSNENLSVDTRSPIKGRAWNDQWLQCVLAEMHEVRWLHGCFAISKSGDGRSTKKIRAGIERLEFLLENWDDLEITGDLKSRYKLELKNDNNL